MRGAYATIELAESEMGADVDETIVKIELAICESPEDIQFYKDSQLRQKALAKLSKEEIRVLGL